MGAVNSPARSNGDATFHDSRQWPDDERWEPIAGVGEYGGNDPVGRWIQQDVPGTDGPYAEQGLFEEKGTLVCAALPGLEIDAAGPWAGP